MKEYREKLDERWQKLLEILYPNTENIINFTQEQILTVLSLQSHIDKIQWGEVFIKNKKKRGWKLDIEKFKKKNF